MEQKIIQGQVPYAGFATHYTIVGEGSKTPIVALHGGPGAGSEGLRSLDALAGARQIIYYDQIGCGGSPAQLPEDAWTVSLFVEELRTLVQTLGLTQFYLLGQSWGSMLAVEYASQYPEGIQGLILTNPIAQMKLYDADTKRLAAKMPQPHRDVLLKSLETDDTEGKAFLEAFMCFFSEHYMHGIALPMDGEEPENPAGVATCGLHPLKTTGNLKDFDCTTQLEGLHMPAIVIHGEYDICSDAQMALFEKHLPHLSRVEKILNSGHIPTADAPEALNQIVSTFLAEVEANA